MWFRIFLISKDGLKCLRDVRTSLRFQGHNMKELRKDINHRLYVLVIIIEFTDVLNV